MRTGEFINIRIENDFGYIILGNTLSTHDAREIRKAFDELEQKDIKNIIIDMSNVTQMDSSGIGVLVIYLKRLKEKNGTIKLMFPREEIKRILKLVNLYTYFEIIE